MKKSNTNNRDSNQNNEHEYNSIETFIEGCYEVYDILENSGKAALSEADASSIKMAINRITAFFIMREEYEKCAFIKQYCEAYLPDFKIIPDTSILVRFKKVD
jgi:hypothetical protein